ncbi:hypothetical protein C8Q79DRAFT_927227 [Trametes meyenii]|nr:hypothetical protein C8Q79DRAFT_927227 [Trametes meyenii]
MEPLERLLNVISLAWFALWVFRCLPRPVALVQLALVSVGTAIWTYGTALRVCTILAMFCILAAGDRRTTPLASRKRILVHLVWRTAGSCLFFAWALSDIVYGQMVLLLSSCDTSVEEAASIVRDWVITAVWDGLRVTFTTGVPTLLRNLWVRQGSFSDICRKAEIYQASMPWYLSYQGVICGDTVHLWVETYLSGADIPTAEQTEQTNSDPTESITTALGTMAPNLYTSTSFGPQTVFPKSRVPENTAPSPELPGETQSQRTPVASDHNDQHEVPGKRTEESPPPIAFFLAAVLIVIAQSSDTTTCADEGAVDQNVVRAVKPIAISPGMNALEAVLRIEETAETEQGSSFSAPVDALSLESATIVGSSRIGVIVTPENKEKILLDQSFEEVAEAAVSACAVGLQVHQSFDRTVTLLVDEKAEMTVEEVLPPSLEDSTLPSEGVVKPITEITAPETVKATESAVLAKARHIQDTSIPLEATAAQSPVLDAEVNVESREENGLLLAEALLPFESEEFLPLEVEARLPFEHEDILPFVEMGTFSAVAVHHPLGYSPVDMDSSRSFGSSRRVDAPDSGPVFPFASASLELFETFSLASLPEGDTEAVPIDTSEVTCSGAGSIGEASSSPYQSPLLLESISYGSLHSQCFGTSPRIYASASCHSVFTDGACVSDLEVEYDEDIDEDADVRSEDDEAAAEKPPVLDTLAPCACCIHEFNAPPREVFAPPSSDLPQISGFSSRAAGFTFTPVMRALLSWPPSDELPPLPLPVPKEPQTRTALPFESPLKAISTSLPGTVNTSPTGAGIVCPFGAGPNDDCFVSANAASRANAAHAGTGILRSREHTALPASREPSKLTNEYNVTHACSGTGVSAPSSGAGVGLPSPPTSAFAGQTPGSAPPMQTSPLTRESSTFVPRPQAAEFYPAVTKTSVPGIAPSSPNEEPSTETPQGEAGPEQPKHKKTRRGGKRVQARRRKLAAKEALKAAIGEVKEFFRLRLEQANTVEEREWIKVQRAAAIETVEAEHAARTASTAAGYMRVVIVVSEDPARRDFANDVEPQKRLPVVEGSEWAEDVAVVK